MKYLSILATLAMASCAGVSAQTVAAITYEVLRVHIHEGISAAQADGILNKKEANRLRNLANQLGVDLAREGPRDAMTLTTAWIALSVFAERGIDRLDVSPGVKELLKQHVATFGNQL